jgi:hypothetical protein
MSLISGQHYGHGLATNNDGRFNIDSTNWRKSFVLRYFVVEATSLILIYYLLNRIFHQNSFP